MRRSSKAGATVFGYGASPTAVVQFLLLAFSVFWLIKIVVTARARIAAEAARLLADKDAEEKKAAEEAAKKAVAEKPAPALAPAPVNAEELKLLAEIRDLLKANGKAAE
ncbi:MAG: MscL family protein [Sutterella seckii]